MLKSNLTIKEFTISKLEPKLKQKVIDAYNMIRPMVLELHKYPSAKQSLRKLMILLHGTLGSYDINPEKYNREPELLHREITRAITETTDLLVVTRKNWTKHEKKMEKELRNIRDRIDEF